VMSTKHEVVSLHDNHILEITNRSLKVEPDKIINDVKKREIPRFRHNPPAQSLTLAVQQLIKTTDGLAGSRPEVLHPLTDFRVQDLELLGKVQRLHSLRTKIDKMEDVTLAPDFRDHVRQGGVGEV